MNEPLWVPTPESLERAEITRYLRRLEERTGRRFDSYDELWQWSIDDLDGFWASVWDHFGLDAVSSYQAVLADDRMPGAVWFPGARLNFAERCLAPGADDDTALVLVGEGETGLNSPVEVTYGELRRQVAAVAATLRQLGVGPGDRVAGYLPNIAEAVVALLATAAVGAVWTVASPDFGTPSVLARLEQAEPVVLIAADGYRFGGKPYDRRTTVAELVAGLPSVRTVLTVDNLAAPAEWDLPVPTVAWAEAVRHRRTAGVRRHRVRGSTVGALVVGHHRRAEGDRALARRDRAGAAQGGQPARGRPARRPVLLRHLDQLDDLELHGRRADGRGRAGDPRRQPELAGRGRRLAGCRADPGRRDRLRRRLPDGRQQRRRPPPRTSSTCPGSAASCRPARRCPTTPGSGPAST